MNRSRLQLSAGKGTMPEDKALVGIPKCLCPNATQHLCKTKACPGAKGNIVNVDSILHSPINALKSGKQGRNLIALDLAINILPQFKLKTTCIPIDPTRRLLGHHDLRGPAPYIS